MFTFTSFDHVWLTGHWGWRVSVCLALLFVAACVLMLTSAVCVLLKGGHARRQHQDVGQWAGHHLRAVFVAQQQEDPGPGIPQPGPQADQVGTARTCTHAFTQHAPAWHTFTQHTSAQHAFTQHASAQQTSTQHTSACTCLHSTRLPVHVYTAHVCLYMSTQHTSACTCLHSTRLHSKHVYTAHVCTANVYTSHVCTANVYTAQVYLYMSTQHTSAQQTSTQHTFAQQTSTQHKSTCTCLHSKRLHSTSLPVHVHTAYICKANVCTAQVYHPSTPPPPHTHTHTHKVKQTFFVQFVNSLKTNSSGLHFMFSDDLISIV